MSAVVDDHVGGGKVGSYRGRSDGLELVAY